jgi:hypothetical protein
MFRINVTDTSFVLKFVQNKELFVLTQWTKKFPADLKAESSSQSSQKPVIEIRLAVN